MERKATEARHARELSVRDAELSRLQQYIDDDLAELQDRQAQVRTHRSNASVKLAPCMGCTAVELGQLAC